MLYNGLIELNPETDDRFNILGDLATSWNVSADGLSFTFHLAEGAKWHDGVPATGWRHSTSLTKHLAACCPSVSRMSRRWPGRELALCSRP